ncbi:MULTISPECIES: YlmC/YmxH family sporulation protein [unclassified Candidatus Frackibacter]|uniref:YlmC/YmxH family sporulation protein n=1 Tax=unclassified Candidatus Frackibacter TaxID=2648818 RepID=UPI00088B22A7|nr:MULTISPECIES: YlmC/YmxH family sporulation protein [unclassified Candidatus Frackibacter]SDB98254.1 sporulation protein, YlmC/YmxH family [Candidatus Frackibacter sp. WG11]SEM29990.1 sporulation protein, YlmC/YmxH family [Candidatus Frackibacter sp. WG12]SFL34948.1 sporulation protein, YlmC/YmxH family [Candidatus Frackibacter sp. WG13]
MKLSELQGKEIINMHDGGRLGIIGETELILNTLTGDLESIIIPNQGGLLSVFGEEKYLIIPWQAVKKVGSEVIIVDLEDGLQPQRASI